MALTLKNANSIIEAALAEARRLNLKPISVVVLDHRAATVALQSEDGVCIIRARIAAAKANAAVQLDMGSRAMMNRAEQQAYFVQAVGALAGGDFIPVPGGVVIRDKNNAILGAVGISGDTSDSDEVAAIAGIKAAGFTPDGG